MFSEFVGTLRVTPLQEVKPQFRPPRLLAASLSKAYKQRFPDLANVPFKEIRQMNCQCKPLLLLRQPVLAVAWNAVHSGKKSS